MSLLISRDVARWEQWSVRHKEQGAVEGEFLKGRWLTCLQTKFELDGRISRQDMLYMRGDYEARVVSYRIG